ncbi:MAG: hypothetical protein IT285_02860 [Bdellovibrionales bacterium]|nr:hypothetical protein [Bdellovibrionales bacterium]
MSIRLALCSAFALAALVAAPAQANFLIDEPSMIEVGAGTAFLGNDGVVEALVSVEAMAATATGPNTAYVIVRLGGDAAIGSEGLTYLDMEFEALGWQAGNQDNFVRASILGLDIQRNLAVNNDLSARFTLLALRGAFTTEVSEDVKVFLRGALDVLSLSYTKRVSDGQDLFGYGFGLEGEVGVELFDRVRITLGEKLGGTLGSPESVYVGVSCDTYSDGYGGYYTSCRDDYATRWNDVRVSSSTYLEILGRITENLSAFGRAAYNLYSVNDRSGSGLAPSFDSEFQFMLGVKYRF